MVAYLAPILHLKDREVTKAQLHIKAFLNV